MTKFEIGAVKFMNHLNQIFPHNKAKIRASAIVTAAGSGVRMGGVSKQLLPLNGKPCILYSLLSFQNCFDIDEIIITAKEDEVETIRTLCIEAGITKLKDIVVGGASRMESVANGFFAVSKNIDLVAIHDAARPLILPDHITLLLENAKRWGASCAAKKMTDTVKRSKENALILETVPREDLYTVQTPQVFKCDLYRASLAMAKKKNIQATDDCALAENAGFPIKLCELSAPNFKMTTSDDVQLLECVLKERELEF